MSQNDMEYTGSITQDFEGYSLTRYQDGGGIWTIGRGHLWHPNDPTPCTPEQVELWFKTDMARSSNAVNDLVAVDVNQDQFNALCDFVFNLGDGALHSSTLLKRLNVRDFEGARGQFIAWDHIRIDGALETSPGLLRRREAEQELFLPIIPTHSV